MPKVLELRMEVNSSLSHQQVGAEPLAAQHDWESSWCGKVPKESCERLDEVANLQEDQEGMLH